MTSAVLLVISAGVRPLQLFRMIDWRPETSFCHRRLYTDLNWERVMMCLKMIVCCPMISFSHSTLPTASASFAPWLALNGSFALVSANTFRPVNNESVKKNCQENCKSKTTCLQFRHRVVVRGHPTVPFLSQPLSSIF